MENLLNHSICAMTQNCSLSGKVVDSISGDFLVYSTIRLLNISDSSIYKGTITGENGIFSLRDIKKGEYLFCISYIGYQERCFKIVFSKEKQIIDLEIIKLFSVSNTLSGVEILSPNRVITKFDRTVYIIDSSLLAGSASTIDVLKKIPDLSVDQINDVINIKGMSNTVVKESTYVTSIENLYEWEKKTSSMRGMFFRFQYFLRHGKDFEQKKIEKYVDDDIKR